MTLITFPSSTLFQLSIHRSRFSPASLNPRTFCVRIPLIAVRGSRSSLLFGLCLCISALKKLFTHCAIPSPCSKRVRDFLSSFRAPLPWLVSTGRLISDEALSPAGLWVPLVTPRFPFRFHANEEVEVLADRIP
jgi:hypothetical protein